MGWPWLFLGQTWTHRRRVGCFGEGNPLKIVGRDLKDQRPMELLGWVGKDLEGCRAVESQHGCVEGASKITEPWDHGLVGLEGSLRSTE